jgi:glycine dehydrogenase subunit 1
VGFADLGRALIARSHYAARRLREIEGVETPFGDGFFKQFVVRFDGTGKSVAEINRALLERGVFGGHDLSKSFPWLGESALYCVTEVHTQADVDRLVEAVAEVVA